LVLASGDYLMHILGFAVNNTLETHYGAQKAVPAAEQVLLQEWKPN
jgi:hypothetical protein